MVEVLRDPRAVLVAVVDSGWHASAYHPRVLPPRRARIVDPDTCSGALEPDECGDLVGHGTLCTRLILDQAVDAQVLPVRIFDSTLECDPMTLMAALDGLRAVGPELVNLSLATQVQEARDGLYIKCEALREAGSIVVAAEQNGGRGGMPAAFENVISVGVRPPQGGMVLSFPASGRLDAVVPYGLEVSAAGGEAQVVRSSSAAAALMSGLIGAWMTEHGHRGIDEVRRSFGDEPARWQGLLDASTKRASAATR